MPRWTLFFFVEVLMATSRLQSSKGRWAKPASTAGAAQGMLSGRPWISLEAVGMWEQALAAADALGKARPAELSRTVEIARSMAVVQGAECRQPLTAKDRERVQEMMEALRGRMASFGHKPQTEPYPLSNMVRSRKHYYESRPWSEVESEGLVLRHFETVAAKKSTLGFVGMPDARWTERPSEALAMEPPLADRLIERAKMAVELAGLLPKAKAQAKALGAQEKGWIGLYPGTLGEAARELASAQARPFEAAGDLQEREAHVLYGMGERSEGFLDKNGVARNDLSEALMFPNLKVALSFAKRKGRGFAGCYAVKVATTVLSFEPILGKPQPSQVLGEALARRENSELERSLRMARVEELEAELEARKNQAQDLPKRASSRL